MIFVKYEQYLLKAQNPNYLLPLMHLKHSNKWKFLQVHASRVPFSLLELEMGNDEQLLSHPNGMTLDT